MTDPAESPIVEVLPARGYASKHAVIQAIGEVMMAAGAVTAAYVDGMLRKEIEASTMVTTEVALPHGTADVRTAVRRNILVVVPIPDGVEWAPGTRARLAIGFAGTGDRAHVRLLGRVARALADDALVERLKAGSDMPALERLFT